jgi:phosphonate transport system substrate-binding protein
MLINNTKRLWTRGLIFFVVCILTSWQSHAEPLKVAFVSYANPQQVAKDSDFLAQYLEMKLGMPVKGFVTLDYGSSIEAMRGDQADIAFVDPLAFMMAHEQIGAVPLLLEVYSSGTPSYRSCIWVRKDAGFTELADLKGKIIAFADQVDMSGHLLPRDLFRREGFLSGNWVEKEFFDEVYFAGGDEQAIRGMLNGFVDVAGVSEYASLLLRPEERDAVKVLAYTMPSPSHLIMARKGVPRETKDKLKKTLLALDPSIPEDKSILDKLYGVRGFAEARLSDFEGVAKVAAGFGFVKNPELFAGSEATE